MIWTIVLAVLAITLILYLIPLLFRGIPFEPTPRDRARRMLELAKVKADDLVYDLGCGTGRILVEAARKFGARAVGIEISPLLYMFSKLNVRLAGVGDIVKVKFGDFFGEDLREATVVTVFQSAGVNQKLKEKLLRELNHGAKVVSYHWPFLGWDGNLVYADKEIFLYEISRKSNGRKAK